MIRALFLLGGMLTFCCAFLFIGWAAFFKLPMQLNTAPLGWLHVALALLLFFAAFSRRSLK